MTVTGDTLVSEIVNKDMNIAAIFMASGIYGIFSPACMSITIEEVALIHGIDPDALIERINEYLTK